MLFKNLGVPELILILVVAMLIFGPGRIGKLGSELGKGIRGFKDGLKSDEQKEAEASELEDTTNVETTDVETA